GARLHIMRLHRLDEGGLFSYHYARIRLTGNRLEISLLAKKDVLQEGSFYEMATTGYEHPSVKFYSPDEFPPSFKPIILFTLDNEFMIWFITKEGLRLYNYRLTWDATNTGNGYNIDVFQQYAVPNTAIAGERIRHIITSDKEVHYIFVKHETENDINVYILRHIDLIQGDFSRMNFLETKMPMDVYPRSIIGNVMPYSSHAMIGKKNAKKFNNFCSYVIAEFYRNQSIGANGKLISDLPYITDPPLALNIFGTHHRSAYPFVQSGRTIAQPNYSMLPIFL
ncbi:hypothetical protein PFISCL1PPCAC_25061, partial [Pristionchus fissidentatus]